MCCLRILDCCGFHVPCQSTIICDGIFQAVTIDIGKEKDALAAGIHHTALNFDTPCPDSRQSNRSSGKTNTNFGNVPSRGEDFNSPDESSVEEVDSIIVCEGINGDGLSKDVKTMSI